MRPDQKERLDALIEKQIDVFMVEADPDEWAGAGKAPSERTKDERGNRAWDLKGVNALANVVRRSQDILAGGAFQQINDPQEQARRDDALDRRIQEAEGRAKRETARVLARHARAPG